MHTSNGVQLLAILPTSTGLRKNGIRRAITEILPRREDFALGDTVSFEGRDLIRKFGKISRINQKTASIVCEDGHEWRVPFALLQRVMSV